MNRTDRKVLLTLANKGNSITDRSVPASTSFKIKEELLMNEEGLQKTRNKLIFIGKQIEIDSDKFISELWKLKTAASANEDDKAIKALHEIVPTFTTPEEFNKTVMMHAVK